MKASSTAFSFLLAASIMAGAPLSARAQPTPTAHDIEAAMAEGNWRAADAGLSQVLRAHPESARAHYLYGQVLDHEGRPAEGLSQIEQARRLDPRLRFTDPSRFTVTERAIRADADRFARAPLAGALPPRRGAQTPAAATQAPPAGVSALAWLGLLIVLAAIAALLVWTVRRARSRDDAGTRQMRREQLKQATDLLNGVRALKLDVRLSSAPDRDALAARANDLESRLRQLVDTLSSRAEPLPAYGVEALAREFESVKALSEGRPDPNAAAPDAGGAAASPYAAEAARFGQTPQPGPGAPPAAPPQTVIVQQRGSGIGMGGGLLTGMVLGEMLGGHRDRVIERDVVRDDDPSRGFDQGDASVDRGTDGLDFGQGGTDGLDFGQGGNDWDDGSSGIDAGNGGSDDSWT